jgi:hypothetical protein
VNFDNEEKINRGKEFSERGGGGHGCPQAFFPGGGKTYYLPKKHLKTYTIFLKRLKNILFSTARGRTRGFPIALPCGHP